MSSSRVKGKGEGGGGGGGGETERHRGTEIHSPPCPASIHPIYLRRMPERESKAS